MILKSFTDQGYNYINYTDCDYCLQMKILEMRNADDIRVWMTSPNIIPISAHLKFVESLKGRDDIYYFAVLRGKELIATLNIRKEEDNTWERGVFTMPNNQGKGITSKIESLFIKHLKAAGIKTLTAKVKNNNLRSLCYHKKAGYFETNRDADYIYYKKIL